MIKIQSRKAKVYLFLGVSLLLFGIVFFLLRGPYLSNNIKRGIIPALENATRERIIINKAVINLFPFYIQAKGLKMFDMDGNRLLNVPKVRAYIDLTALLSKELRVRKLTVMTPSLTAGEKDFRRIRENMRKSSSIGEKGEYRVSVRNIQLTNGDFAFSNKEGTITTTGRKLFVNMVTKESVIIDFELGRGMVRAAGLNEFRGRTRGRIVFRDNDMEIRDVEVKSSGSSLFADGELSMSEDGGIRKGQIRGRTEITTETLNTIFDIKQKNDGKLAFEGSVNFTEGTAREFPEVTLDLETESRFYLEALMDILEVDEDIGGLITLNGRITGPLSGLNGKGTVRLDDGVLGGLPIDDLAGRIEYRDNRFDLHDFTGVSYGGAMEGDAHILLPHGDYAVSARVSDVDSPDFFRFIEWDAPFPKGKVDGSFHLVQKHDRDIMVTADISYRNTSNPEGDLLDRLETIHTGLELREDVLTLQDTLMTTARSELLLDGTIDFNNDTLVLNMRLESDDAAELTAPYYGQLHTPVFFQGTAGGTLEDPVLSGTVRMDGGNVSGMEFTHAAADLTYRIRSLMVDRLYIEQGDAEYDASGTVEFRKAGELFSFQDPLYSGRAKIKNVHVSPYIIRAYRELPVSGLASGTLEFEGDSDDYTADGDLVVEDADVYGQHLDRVNVQMKLYPAFITFSSVNVRKDESVLDAHGTLFFDRRYEIVLSSTLFDTCDIGIIEDYPLSADLGIEAHGSGTFDEPRLAFSVNVLSSYYNEVQIGEGNIQGTLDGGKIQASGTFFNGILDADASIELGADYPWSADVNFRKGRYGFLLSNFIDDAPRDLTASLQGTVSLTGHGRSVSMKSAFDYMNFGIYGFNFRNSDDIVIELQNNTLSIKSFRLKGANAELFAEGKVNINRGYDLKMGGNMNIAPLRIFAEKVTSLNGTGEFDVYLAGRWEKPELSGEISIREALVNFNEFPYKIGPVDGTFFLRKDRVVFDSIKTHFAGGTVLMSGVGYFDGLLLKKVFLSSDIAGIHLNPVEGVSAVVDGRLFYETSDDGYPSLAGEIEIEKARYQRRIEWQGWMMGINEIKSGQMEYPKFLTDTELNIGIVGRDDIIIDNNYARTPVSLNLNITGTVQQYGLVGRIEADEGKVYFRGNEFNILEGSNVDFVNPNSISPVFHVLADTYSGDYYIRLSLDGTMDKFSLSLFSDPPLKENEILSLLTFGQIYREARGIESGIAASEATALVTGNIKDKVEEEVEFITGFDRFEIEPHTTTEGAFVPRVTIGKRMFEDRIFVEYSSSVGTAEEQIIEVEYKLSDNLSLIGSRNEIGSAGADIKYRFEFK